MTRYLFCNCLFLLLFNNTKGQAFFANSIFETAKEGCKPAQNRQLFHEYVDAQQKLLLKSDGKDDGQYSIEGDNEEINFMLTQAATKKINALQCKIETDTLLGQQDKIRYIRGVELALKFFISNTKTKKVKPVLLPGVVDAYEACMQADRNKQMLDKVIAPLRYEVAYSVIMPTSLVFDRNAGYTAARESVILKYCQQYPDRAFQTLKENPDLSFADSLIRVTAKKYPRQLYDYSQANNKLGALIRNVKDDKFVQSVVQMSRSKSGQQYFPFLDNVVSGKMTFEGIDAVMNDSIQYYKLLVKTQIDYVNRAINKDTAYEFKALTQKLERKAIEVFITTINGLHEENDIVRYKCLQSLSAEELYYLAVSSDGEIYTSSFVNGVYPLMMKKMNNRGDSLLMRLHFDKYRKFIKMAAGYNTLANFLNSFPKQEDADNLMRAFVNNLERTEGLEDGVDVADSYASIAEVSKSLAQQMLANVQYNYDRCLTTNGKRGMVIYNILQRLFLSADTVNKIDLTKELGIPPVYEVPFKSLANESGRVIMEVFFYGDKDGRVIFQGFQNMFPASNWKIDRSNPYWIEISSIKGKPVSIFANRPLDEEKGEDEKAQRELSEYLEKNQLNPTVTIHRGHSYYANSTIAQMFPSSKIIFMGSCGGYHLVHDVLEISPDAHIIASKQIGKTAINRPFFELLTEKIRMGSNIEWIPFWQEFQKKAKVEGFEDYIPPYKNLGALFVKAYKIAMGAEIEEAKGF